MKGLHNERVSVGALERTQRCCAELLTGTLLVEALMRDR
jgi:hypothetical protein